jgi:hypothetical protein
VSPPPTPAEPEPDPDRPAPPVRWYRIAFTVTATLALGVIVTLPFSLQSVLGDALDPPREPATVDLAGAATVARLERAQLTFTGCGTGTL